MPSTSTRTSSAARGSRERKLLAAGLLAGAAVGTWVTTRNRPTEQSDAKAPALIDWEKARGIAVRMNRGVTLTAVERDRLDGYYRDLVQRCIPIVADYTGVKLPRDFDQVYA